MKRKSIVVLLLVLLSSGCHADKKLERGADHSMEQNLNVEEQMIELAAMGETEQVLQFVREGANLNAQDSEGRTAVLAATYANEQDTVKALIEEGANIDLQDDRLDNVMLHAGANGYLEIVKLAIAAGADMTLTNRYGGTALIPAADRGHVETVEELLKNSEVDIDHINNLHWTALLEAVILGDGGKKHQEIVQLLVDHGADIAIADGDGITSLEHARNRGFNEIENILTAVQKKSSSSSVQ